MVIFECNFCIELNIWGNDIENSKWVFKTGDADGRGFWTHKKPLLIKSVSPSTIIPVSVHNEDKTPFLGDPIHLLRFE